MYFLLLGPTTLSKYFAKPSVHRAFDHTSTFLFEILLDEAVCVSSLVDGEIKHLLHTWQTQLDQLLQHEQKLISSITKFWFWTS